MGTICAPSYANIFLWLILKENKYTHQVRTSPFFTYDIFMISLWYGKEHTANYKKRNHEISKEEIAFLDTKIHIDDKKNTQTQTTGKKQISKVPYIQNLSILYPCTIALFSYCTFFLSWTLSVFCFLQWCVTFFSRCHSFMLHSLHVVLFCVALS